MSDVPPEVETTAPVTGARRSTTLYAVATYATSVGASVLGLANVLVVSRTLGPAGRGQVAFLTTISTLTALAVAMGVQSANAYFGASRAETRAALATNSVLFAALFGGVGIGAVALLIHFVPDAGADIDPTTRWIAVASIPVVVLGNYLTMLLQSDYRFAVSNATLWAASFINVSVNGILALIGELSVRSAISTWVAGQVLATVVLATYTSRRLSGFAAPDAALGRRMLGFGSKTYAGQVGMVGNYRLDQWLLGAISGQRALGLYSVAVAWSEVLFLLPTSVVTALRPDLVRAEHRSAGESAARAFRLTAMLTVASAAVMIAAAPFLCTTLFGPSFAGSIRDLRLLAFGAIGIAAIKQLGNALTTQGKPLRETAGIVVAFAITAVADLLLIPPHADLGASIASLVTYFAGGLVMAAIFARSFDRPLLDLVPRPSDLRWCLTVVGVRFGALR